MKSRKGYQITMLCMDRGPSQFSETVAIVRDATPQSGKSGNLKNVKMWLINA